MLNVGFGLGIIDAAIQRHAPRSHTIIEAHPDVYQHMLSQGWDKKPGVRVVFGRWQDVIGEASPDGACWLAPVNNPAPCCPLLCACILRVLTITSDLGLGAKGIHQLRCMIVYGHVLR